MTSPHDPRTTPLSLMAIVFAAALLCGCCDCNCGQPTAANQPCYDEPARAPQSRLILTPPPLEIIPGPATYVPVQTPAPSEHEPTLAKEPDSD